MCGSTEDLTDEHVISRTVRKQLANNALVIRHYDGRESAKQVIHVVLDDAVCGNCNNSWMRELEDDFVSLLGPQIRAEGAVVLDPAQCERVATWAVKTALLLDVHHAGLGRARAGAPENNLRWLAEYKSPLPRCEVWMGAYDHLSHPHHPHWSQPAVIYGDSGRPIAYTCPFTIGALIFYVVGEDLDVNIPDSLEPPAWFCRVFARVWPTAETVGWPHEAYLPTNDLGAVQAWLEDQIPSRNDL